MTAMEVVPAERYEPESAAVVLWGTNEPRAMTARMSAIADAMADVVKQRRLTVKIGTNEYVKSEGWSMVGAMIGVFPHPRAVEEIREGEALVGFRATVDLVTRDGNVVGGAVALCTIGEEKWADRDWNQLASMAQTRATAKAYRQTLGFIMPMAGYAPTPAEEMDGIGERDVAPPSNEPEPRPMQPRAETKRCERDDCPEKGSRLVQSKKSGQWGHVLKDGSACLGVNVPPAQQPLEAEVVEEKPDYVSRLIERATAELEITVGEFWALVDSTPDDLAELVVSDEWVEKYLTDIRTRVYAEAVRDADAEEE